MTLIFFSASQFEFRALRVVHEVAPLPWISPASMARWILGVPS
jgi:hypothetical protein